MKFYKLYTPPSGQSPQDSIDVYYCGVPLHTQASFDRDRYSFQLPLNLRDKMMTGNLYADLCYSARKEDVRKGNTPVSLVLSDRYD